MTPERLLRQAIEFARRGFAALVVMRRGYGDFRRHLCREQRLATSRNYLRSAATASAADLRAAIDRDAASAATSRRRA